MRPLYIDPQRTDLPVVYLMSTGGGIVQGDRLRMDFDCSAGASVHLTTQAATKVHRMDAGFATQMVNVSAGPGAYVEYLPQPIIPFGGSRLYQRTVVAAHPSATVLAGELMMAGRLARGEVHEYDVFASDFEVRRPGDRCVAVDRVRLEPRRGPVTGPGMFGANTLMASLYVVSPLQPADAIAKTLHAALAESPVLYGVSVLPQDSGAWVRTLGNDSPAMQLAVHATWDAVRRVLIGAPAPDFRRS